MDDHLFFAVGGGVLVLADLETELATWYMERFGRPGKTLLVQTAIRQQEAV
jgi:hypothetical protein